MPGTLLLCLVLGACTVNAIGTTESPSDYNDTRETTLADPTALIPSESIREESALLPPALPLSQQSAEEAVAAVEALEAQQGVSQEDGGREGRRFNFFRGPQVPHRSRQPPPPPPPHHRFVNRPNPADFDQRRPTRQEGSRHGSSGVITDGRGHVIESGSNHKDEVVLANDGKSKPDLNTASQTLYDLRGFNQQGQQQQQQQQQQLYNPLPSPFGLQQHPSPAAAQNSFSFQNFQQQPQQPEISPATNYDLNLFNPPGHQHRPTAQELQRPQQPIQHQSSNDYNRNIVYSSFYPGQQNHQQQQQQQQQAQPSPTVESNQYQVIGTNANGQHFQISHPRHPNVFGHNQHFQQQIIQLESPREERQEEKVNFRPSQIDPGLTKPLAATAISVTQAPLTATTDNSLSFTPVHAPFPSSQPSNKIKQQALFVNDQNKFGQNQRPAEDSFVYVYEDVDYEEEANDNKRRPHSLDTAKESNSNSNNIANPIRTNQPTAILIDTSASPPQVTNLPVTVNDHENPSPFGRFKNAGPVVEIVPSSERKPPPDQSNAVKPALGNIQTGLRGDKEDYDPDRPAPFGFRPFERPGPPFNQPQFEPEEPLPPPPASNLNQFVRRPNNNNHNNNHNNRPAQQQAPVPQRRPDPEEYYVDEPSPPPQQPQRFRTYNKPTEAPIRVRPVPQLTNEIPQTPANVRPPSSGDYFEPQVLPPFSKDHHSLSFSDSVTPGANEEFQPQKYVTVGPSVIKVQAVTRRPPRPVTTAAPTTTTPRSTTTSRRTPTRFVYEEELDEDEVPVVRAPVVTEAPPRSRFPPFKSSSATTTTTTRAPETTRRTTRPRIVRPERIQKQSTTPIPDVSQELDDYYDPPKYVQPVQTVERPSRFRTRHHTSRVASTTTAAPTRSTSERINPIRRDKITLEDRQTRRPQPSRYEDDFEEDSRPTKVIERPSRHKTSTSKPKKTGKPLYASGKMLEKEGGVYANFRIPTAHVYGSPIPILPVHQVFDRFPDIYGPTGHIAAPPRHVRLPPLPPQSVINSPVAPLPGFGRPAHAGHLAHHSGEHRQSFKEQPTQKPKKSSRNKIIYVSTPEPRQVNQEHEVVQQELDRPAAGPPIVILTTASPFQSQTTPSSRTTATAAPSPVTRGRIGGRRKRPLPSSATTPRSIEAIISTLEPQVVRSSPVVRIVSETGNTDPTQRNRESRPTQAPEPIVVTSERPQQYKRRPGGRPTFKKPKPSLPFRNEEEPPIPAPKPQIPRKLRARPRPHRLQRPKQIEQQQDEQQPEEAQDVIDTEELPRPRSRYNKHEFASTTGRSASSSLEEAKTTSARVFRKPTEAPGRFSSRFREEDPPFVVTKQPIQLTTKSRPSFKPKKHVLSPSSTAAPKRRVPNAEDDIPPQIRLKPQDVIGRRKPARRIPADSVSLRLQEKRKRLQNARGSKNSDSLFPYPESDEDIESNNNKREISPVAASENTPQQDEDKQIHQEPEKQDEEEHEKQEKPEVEEAPVTQAPKRLTSSFPAALRVTKNPKTRLQFGNQGKRTFIPSTSTTTTTTTTTAEPLFELSETKGIRADVSASLSTSTSQENTASRKFKHYNKFKHRDESPEAAESVITSSTIKGFDAAFANPFKKAVGSSESTISPFALFSMATQEPHLPLESVFSFVNPREKEAT